MKILIIIVIISNLLLAQNKTFELEDALSFHEMNYSRLSDDGNWLIYRTSPDRGNGILYIRSTEDSTKYEFERAGSPNYSENMETISFIVKPDVVDIKNDKDNELADTIYILNPQNGNLSLVPNGKNNVISNDGKWLKYKKKNFEKNEVFLREIESGTDLIIENVKESKFDSTSNYLFYIRESEKNNYNGIYYRDLTKRFAPEIAIETDTNAKFDELSWNTKKNILAYKKTILDSNDEETVYDIRLFDFKKKSISNAVFSQEFSGWYIPKKNNLYWTEDGERLWFGIKPDFEKIDEKEEEEKITKEDYYSFDSLLKKTEMYLWHYNDDRIITEKRTKWNSIKDRYYEAVFHLNSKRVVQIGDTNLVNVSRTNNNLYTLAYDINPYEKRITWDYWYYDLYIVDLFSGERILIEKELISEAFLSPLNRSVAYFKDDHWYVYDIPSKSKKNITKSLEKTNFYNELNDRPRKNMPYGFAGWYKTSNDFIIYDRYDIWEVNADNGAMKCLTQATGRIDKVRFRINKFDKEFFEENSKFYLELFYEKSKKQALNILSEDLKLFEINEDKYIKYVAKAKNSDKILISKERYDLFPDLYITNTELDNVRKLTNIHPEIAEYNWGETEIIEYVNSVGDTLMGYYITPDNFDSSKKYPLFVYFYERFSDRRHRFVSTRINHRPIYPWYVGQGYCMFFPDIKFRIGRPGDSGLDGVLSGIRALAKKGFIDTNKVALHGHSWSGYQSAYFVTQTDFFAACVTGAPVSNMTSAYSGIRLGSGLARQFQYEKTQSRIGGTLIDSLDAYIENSPVFYADQMNTPMLIMFGDIDDAVPWQQGVELYLACRRFNKPAIFLQYENEPHHLKKYPNKLDYTIKMKQFFDHYVLGKEAAEWIKEGVEYRGTYNTGN